MVRCKRNVTSNPHRWFIGLLCLSQVWLAAAPAQPARAGASSPQDCLKQALAQSISNPAFATELLRQASLTPHEAMTSGEKDGISVVALVRRLPDSLDARQRRELIQQRAAAELFKLRALKSAPFDAALKSFQFPELLTDFARKRLLETVTGQLAPESPAPAYLDCGDCLAVVLRIPNTAVQLEFVRLASDQATLVAYVTSLMRAAKRHVQAGEVQVAGRYLTEAGKLGYRSKDWFICLYQCQAQLGNRTEAEKTSQQLQEQHAAGLSFDDCLNLAQAADRAKFTSQAAIWNQFAEAKIREGLPTRDSAPKPANP